MDCAVPGRIIVGPDPEGRDARDRLREILDMPFDVEFSFSDVLVANDIKEPERWGGTSLPFTVRVPEGDEEVAASRLQEHGFSSLPDLLVRPSASIAINSAVIGNLIASQALAPPASYCGTNCVIGILDSGIDPTLVPTATLSPKQYDASTPYNLALRPSDTIGHGSLVAYIIHRIAPGATLIPVKVTGIQGSVFSVLAGLYLADAAGPCDVLNLSLKISCNPNPCAVCGSRSRHNRAQLSLLFKSFSRLAPNTVMVASAGNKSGDVALPADLDEMIAVGSFDINRKVPISTYKTVPKDRYVLAPDGANNASQALAHRSTIGATEYFYGTSFATAFVTGFAGRVICGAKGSPCGALAVAGATTPLQAVLDTIRRRADRSWNSFDPALHGLGTLQL